MILSNFYSFYNKNNISKNIFKCFPGKNYHKVILTLKNISFKYFGKVNLSAHNGCEFAQTIYTIKILMHILIQKFLEK
jgi:hypothetical protein